MNLTTDNRFCPIECGSVIEFNVNPEDRLEFHEIYPAIIGTVVAYDHGDYRDLMVFIDKVDKNFISFVKLDESHLISFEIAKGTEMYNVLEPLIGSRFLWVPSSCATIIKPPTTPLTLAQIISRLEADLG